MSARVSTCWGATLSATTRSMQPEELQRLRSAIRDIADFPKPGIVFKDITPVLADPAVFQVAIEAFASACRDLEVEKIVGIDARGFIFGAAVAYKLGLGFVPVRKKGKLPYETVSQAYALEYGEAIVEMHVDAVREGERVVIVDDLLATGGTAAAAMQLLAQKRAQVLEAQFLVELCFLGGRQKLATSVRSFITY
jgi:adenine phosphoribosyltransferase